MKKRNILLFGSGYMAEEYLKVLATLKCNIFLVGRNEEKAKALARKYNANGFGGGVVVLNKISIPDIDLAIVATSVESLSEVALVCLERGIENILLEKPGALNLNQLKEIKAKLNKNTRLVIAYNRRFYNSVITLAKKMKEDRGALGCFFDFTDREKDILSRGHSLEVIKKWGWGNSSHVIDTAFYLVGQPLEIYSLREGYYKCHPDGNIFVGSGRTKHCPFSYFSTWSGGGRWNIEVSTKKGRYKLSPLEELSFCRKNQFSWEDIEFPDDDDKKFKPGLYKMVKSTLINNEFKNLPDIDEQIRLCKIINKIFGYED